MGFDPTAMTSMRWEDLSCTAEEEVVIFGFESNGYDLHKVERRSGRARGVVGFNPKWKVAQSKEQCIVLNSILTAETLQNYLR